MVLNAKKKSSVKSRLIKTKGVAGLSIPSTDTILNYRLDPVSMAARKFVMFWDMMEVLRIHGYLRAATSIVGRTALSAGWELVRNVDFLNDAKKYQYKKLKRFYAFENRDWSNIRDYYSFAHKIKIAVMYLHYFGQCAFHIIRDESGNALGLDFLHGLNVPNIDEHGNFKSPAFYQYTSPDPKAKVEFSKFEDIIYITNPDFAGSILGSSDAESLASFNLPLDILLQDAANNYIINRDKPEAIYQLPEDITDEAFEAFAQLMDKKYSGTGNIGNNPMVVSGEMTVTELSGMPDALPYNESRAQTRSEMLAVLATPGEKLGVPASETSGTSLKEIRREFHESTMIPIFALIEQGFKDQIHLREFDIVGWDFKFGQPDFLTAVERATVNMRYRDIGVFSANEIRAELHLTARDDEDGDEYVPTKGISDEEEQGSPPEGREDDPDSPANVGEPTLDDQDPPRGDDHDDAKVLKLRDIRKELKQWQDYLLRRLDKNRPMHEIRNFELRDVPMEIGALLEMELSIAVTKEDVKTVFDKVFEELEEYEKQ